MWSYGDVLSLYKDLELPHCSNVLSANVTPVFEKWWLHTYCARNFLVCTALQGFSSLCAHNGALCNNEITNYRNETVIHMVSVFCYIPATTFCCTGYTACWSATQMNATQDE
jgi:hypothetical protein